MSVRPLYADDLVDLAYHLAGRGAGPGKPRTIWLRRAISTAYYAVFHELTTQAAAELAESARSDQQHKAARWISHTDLRALADGVLGRGSARAVLTVLDPLAPEPELVSRRFVQLQDARHQADYDHGYATPRSQALKLVDFADQAVRTARHLNRNQDPSYRVFLRLMVGSVKIARNR